MYHIFRPALAFFTSKNHGKVAPFEEKLVLALETSSKKEIPELVSSAKAISDRLSQPLISLWARAVGKGKKDISKSQFVQENQQHVDFRECCNKKAHLPVEEFIFILLRLEFIKERRDLCRFGNSSMNARTVTLGIWFNLKDKITKSCKSCTASFFFLVEFHSLTHARTQKKVTIYHLCPDPRNRRQIDRRLKRETCHEWRKAY